MEFIKILELFMDKRQVFINLIMVLVLYKVIMTEYLLMVKLNLLIMVFI